MIAKSTSAVLLLVMTVAVCAQQPNTANHSMTINGLDGPPFPIQPNYVRTSLPASFAFGTIPNQPYALYQGTLHQGPGFSFANGLVDLNLSPAPAKILDGFSNPAYYTDFTGTATFTVNTPNVGTPPNGVALGLQLSEQALVGDPFNSFGYSLTAATRVVVSQGPIIQYYSLGDESEQAVTLPGTMPIPFYGTNRTTLYLGSNGYICLGSTAGSDYTPTPSEMLSGPPRIAGQWCDLDCPANSVRTTLDTSTANGNTPYFKVDFINVPDWTIAINHNFSFLLRNDGYLEIISAPTNNASSYDQMVGICAGGNLGGASQGQKNFIGPQPPGSSVGPGILSTSPFAYVGAVNEAFYEWFGILTQNAFYQAGQSYDNPYDLPAVTLHFSPTGAGSAPGNSNRYVLY
jgi:hypothetical protein